MTLTLFASAFGVLAWPNGLIDAHRARALQAARRLAPMTNPQRVSTGCRWGELWARASTGAPGAIAPAIALAIALVIAAVTAPTQGRIAATEFGLCGLALSFVGVRVARQIVDGRRRSRRGAQVSLALALIIGELEVGASPQLALKRAGAVGAEIAHSIDVGDTDDGVGDDLIARITFAWQMSIATGAALVELLTHVRADLAALIDGDRDLRAAIAGPQASATVVALLPLLGVALGAAIGANPIATLFATPLGHALLCIGVLLDAVGVVWALRIIAGPTR